MCGIAGIWGNCSTSRLAGIAQALAHRGPDEEGVWVSPHGDFGLAHRRLCIIDPSSGHQPIANESGRIITAFNGAIYNYVELRDELIAQGHAMRTSGDTETIVHLFEQHGIDFVQRLRGMFAIALWDDDARTLVLVRDRVGQKPLYYAQSASEFIFASEIKGVVAAMSEAVQLDNEALSAYFAWGVVPGPRTIYRQIQSVEPGELIVVRDRRIVRRERYWQPRFVPKEPITRREAVERVDAMLAEAVRLRLRADVPIGAFLSGGIDSGLITAMAATHHSRRLATITVGFEGSTLDERPLARMVAQHYGTDHHELVVRPSVMDDLPAIAQAFDQPFADSSAIPSFIIARATRSQVKVALNGDGGDELFAGYRRYVAGQLLATAGRVGGPWLQPMARFLAARLPAPRQFRTGYAFLHRWIRGAAEDPVTRYLQWTSDGWTTNELGALSRNGFDGRVHQDERPWVDRLATLAMSNGSELGVVDRMMAADFATVLPYDLLVKMDIACMAHGLEGRSPFLDHELIEQVMRFPERVKLNGLTTKPILRELARRYLPESVSRAPKRGFEVPLGEWLKCELRSLAHDLLLSRNGLLDSLFKRSRLEQLLHVVDRPDPARWSRQVWILLMLGLWDRHVYRGGAAVR